MMVLFEKQVHLQKEAGAADGTIVISKVVPIVKSWKAQDGG